MVGKEHCGLGCPHLQTIRRGGLDIIVCTANLTLKNPHGELEVDGYNLPLKTNKCMQGKAKKE